MSLNQFYATHNSNEISELMAFEMIKNDPEYADKIRPSCDTQDPEEKDNMIKLLFFGKVD